MRRLFLACLCAALGFACRREAAPRPSAASAAPSASVSTPKPRPWYEGNWKGSYDAVLHRIELPAGGVRDWKADDGGAASGKGSLNLSIDAEGHVTGEAEGPLGALGVNGSVDAEQLRLEFAPRTGMKPSDFHGVAVITREGDTLKGGLQASTGDSLKARSANIELRRAESPR